MGEGSMLMDGYIKSGGRFFRERATEGTEKRNGKKVAR